jgi:hypothetical protein
MDCLSPDASMPQAVGPLQSATMLAIVDAYDRKLERGPFCATVSACIELYGAMGSLHTLRIIKRGADEPTYRDDLDIAIRDLTGYATRKQEEVKEMVKLMVQCPTEDDPIS